MNNNKMKTDLDELEQLYNLQISVIKKIDHLRCNMGPIICHDEELHRKFRGVRDLIAELVEMQEEIGNG